jgi:hypothetical protein
MTVLRRSWAVVPTGLAAGGLEDRRIGRMGVRFVFACAGEFAADKIGLNLDRLELEGLMCSGGLGSAVGSADDKGDKPGLRVEAS